MNHKILSLLISVIGILVLYYLSLLSQPNLINIDQVEQFEGNLVSIKGTITATKTISQNNQAITIMDNTSTLPVFIDDIVEVQIGDQVKVTGTIQKYNDEWQLVSDLPDSVIILSSWKNHSINLTEIAQNPTKYIDQNVNVTGYVDIVFDSYFHLTDDNYQYTFLVEKPYIKNVSLYPGKKISIQAQFTYDSSNTRYLFEFNSQNHTIIEIRDEV